MPERIINIKKKINNLLLKNKPMKKFIIFIIIVFAAAWALQNYTSFKALDYAKEYYQKIDLSKASDYIKNLKLSEIFKKETPDPEKQLNIFIRDGQFVPNMNAAKAGINVTWINEDTKPHTVTGESWGSRELMPAAKYSRTFDTAGNYKYHCSSHPSETGELIVK
ncbi:MAG TPA: hypothetical protein DHI91_01525 [Candidatus Portnoybacteria bacterium]|nr:hypothetical protein [Candidatus Portnoybacteria bacterium]